jgi:hypothetical protein
MRELSLATPSAASVYYGGTGNAALRRTRSSAMFFELSDPALLRLLNALGALLFAFGGAAGVAITSGAIIMELQVANTVLFYITAIAVLALVAGTIIVFGQVSAELARRLMPAPNARR